MSVPLLVAVDDDPELLREVERELTNRYVPDYRVLLPGLDRHGSRHAGGARGCRRAGAPPSRGTGARRSPLLVLPNGNILEDPSDADIARARGPRSTRTATGTTS
jgi:hypothetical protein